jgi:SAM-dependent methyltransferase
MSGRDFEDQEAAAHKLPPARLVERFAFLGHEVRGCRVIHVGFTDAGFRAMQDRTDRWLHAHLDQSAKELVGLDVDEAGVRRAGSQGWEAYAVDCTDRAAVEALDLEPADVVIAGEVIEHVPNPGSLLDALHPLVAPGGRLVVTTPNAAGWLNPMASLGGYEVNHPDHLVMFTCTTLTALLDHEGWGVAEVATFCPEVKGLTGGGWKLRVLALGARLAVWIQRTAARTVAPFAADGLIVVARSREERHG